MTSESSVQVFDKKFVMAACLIGFAYAVVVAGLGAYAGKEVAGVAAVALTALATAIFKQFETLRFRALADSEAGPTIVVPKLSGPRILLLCFAFLGAQLLLGLLLGLTMALTNVMPDISRVEDIFALLADWKVFSVIVGVKLVAYFLAGFLVRRSFQVSMYSELVLGAFIAIALPDLLPLAALAIDNWSLLSEMFESGASTLWLAAFWLPFVAAAFLGARLGRSAKGALQATGQQVLRPVVPALAADKPAT